MQTLQEAPQESAPKYWMRGLPLKFATALCGVIAVFIAIKAVTYEPTSPDGPAVFDYFVRVLSFSALTVWVTFAIGIRRRGAAAIIALGFATVLELILVPMRTDGLPMIVASNLGIVLSYCAAQLYWLTLKEQNAVN